MEDDTEEPLKRLYAIVRLPHNHGNYGGFKSAISNPLQRPLLSQFKLIVAGSSAEVHNLLEKFCTSRQ